MVSLKYGKPLNTANLTKNSLSTNTSPTLPSLVIFCEPLYIKERKPWQEGSQDGKSLAGLYFVVWQGHYAALERL